MTKSKVVFPEVLKGYDMEQVDSYVGKLSEAYQLAYDENTTLREKYNNLLEECKQGNMQQLVRVNSDNIAKILMYADMLAQKIIADAQEEAAKVKLEAQKIYNNAEDETAYARETAQKIIDDANIEVMQANEAAHRILERANAEANRAQKLLSDANAESIKIVTQARKNVSQAHETMEQAISKIQTMMAFHAPDIKRIAAE